MHVLFLGTGGSLATPQIGCHCPVCTSKNPKNRRTRPSVLLKIDGKRFLIDAGPDYHEQALTHKIDHLDGILITHPHYDHIGGIDELRIYAFVEKHPIPCILSKTTYDEIERRWHYMFKPRPDGHIHSPQLDFQILKGKEGDVTVAGVKWHYFSYFQAEMPVTGFRLDNFAYVTDIQLYDESLFKLLSGVETLIVSALRPTVSRMHLTFDQAIAFAKRVGAKRTYFTHISHDVDHEIEEKRLPSGIHIAYDGLEIDVE